MSKPILYFFKLSWCGHCVHFDEGNKSAGVVITPAQWPLLVNDPEMQGLVTMVRYEWNPKKTDPNYKPMLAGYEKRINYGPAFCIETGKNADGTPIFSEFKSGGIVATAADVKKWVVSQLGKTAVKDRPVAMNGQAMKPAAPKAATPKAHPAPANKPAGVPNRIPNRVAPPAAQKPAPPTPQPRVAVPATPMPPSPPQRNGQGVPTAAQPTVFEYRGSGTTYSHVVDLRDE